MAEGQVTALSAMSPGPFNLTASKEPFPAVGGRYSRKWLTLRTRLTFCDWFWSWGPCNGLAPRPLRQWWAWGWGVAAELGYGGSPCG